jgi:hypothetical protein
MRHVQSPGKRSGADRLTHAGVLNRLGPQTDGVVSWRDPTALPCSHPHCCSAGYMLRTDQGEWRSLVAIMGHDELKSRLDLVSNTIADWQAPAKLRLLVKESLLGLLSEQSSLTHPTVTDLLRNICENCDLGMATGDAAASGPGYDQCAPFLRRAGLGPAGPAEADIGVRDVGARAGQGGGAACSRLSGTVLPPYLRVCRHPSSTPCGTASSPPWPSWHGRSAPGGGGHGRPGAVGPRSGVARRPSTEQVPPGRRQAGGGLPSRGGGRGDHLHDPGSPLTGAR